MYPTSQVIDTNHFHPEVWGIRLIHKKRQLCILLMNLSPSVLPRPMMGPNGTQWWKGFLRQAEIFMEEENVTSKMAMRGGFWSHDFSDVWNVKDKACNLSQANPMASASLFYKYVHSCLSAMSYFALENPTWLSSSSLPIDPVRNPLETGPSHPLWPSLIQVRFLNRARAG